MAFNSDTYRANKYANSAWHNLANARAIKRRVASGEAFEWERGRIATYVKLARLDMRISLSCRRIAETY